MIVAALAAEANVAEADTEAEEGVAVGGTDAVAAPKPKKGKAALPLKRDRVCFKIL